METGRGSRPAGQLPAGADQVWGGGGGERGLVDPAYPAVVNQVKKNNLCFNVQKLFLAEQIFSVPFLKKKVFYKEKQNKKKQKKFER